MAVERQVIYHVLERLRVLHAVELINKIYTLETVYITICLLGVQWEPSGELIHHSNDVGNFIFYFYIHIFEIVEVTERIGGFTQKP